MKKLYFPNQIILNNPLRISPGYFWFFFSLTFDKEQGRFVLCVKLMSNIGFFGFSSNYRNLADVTQYY